MVRVFGKEWVEKLVLMRRAMGKLFGLEEVRRRKSEEGSVLKLS